MPEIAGKECSLVNPFKEEDIANALLLLENDLNYYDKQITYGLNRVKSFSWTKTAELLLELYKNIK